MDKQQATTLISSTFENAFDEGQYIRFLRELFNGQIDESDDRKFDLYGQYIPDSFKDAVRRYKRLGTYTDPAGHEVDLLVVILRRDSALERARTMQRNFAAYHLKRREKETAVIAYITEERGDWRFSMVRRESVVAFSEKGNLIAKDELTPVRRYSFLVGQNERSHTAQQQLLPILVDDKNDPTLDRLEDAFNIETVTKEFFERYKNLFLQLKEELDRLIAQNPRVQAEFSQKGLETANFAKKLLGQIVFLYFLQKKGWLGVRQGDNWGAGPRNFLRELFDRNGVAYDNFFNDVLEPLFYEALAIERRDNIYTRLNVKIPFLNGGLFEPVGNYDWRNIDMLIDNGVFKSIFDTFDLYNFTVREDEPLEKEVAVDPEMLGKVFENLLEVTDRKSKGAFYTPREIVHYMCQESLINYLDTRVNMGTRSVLEGDQPQQKLFDLPPEKGEQLSLTETIHQCTISREDIATFIRFGELAVQNDIAKEAGTKTYDYQMPESIRTHAKKLDDALANIKICDPAIGSGAFPVGMMQEIIKAREVLTTYLGSSDERTTYHFKRQAIQESIYGVDIDPGAIDIAKLRLWLSLVVDEDDYHHIKPLPNLDYKIVCGNSLLGVDKNLFNLDLFQRLEKLKLEYFGQTDAEAKQIQRADINALIALITGDLSVFDFHIYFSEVFHNNGGFDVVIANPPYVGEKGNKSTFRQIASGPLGRFYQGKVDLFYFFFHLAINLSRERGCVTFITTNYYPTATGAKKLRNDFKDRTVIHNLINFNELKIFESALGQHNMIAILEKAGSSGAIAHNCITKRKGIATRKILQDILSFADKETEYFQVPQNDLYDGQESYIRIQGSKGNDGNLSHRILSKMSERNPLLGDLCNVNIGMRTGADKVTNSHIETYNLDLQKGEGIYVLNDIEKQRLNLNSAEKPMLLPFFKNSDIEKFYCKLDNDLWLIDLTYPKYKSPKWDAIPHIYEHISRYEVILKNRRSNDNGLLAVISDGYWWCYTMRQLDFTQDKIVCPQRSKVNTFAFNSTHWVASMDVYFITQSDNSISLKYILSLLNSKLYYFWLYHKGKKKGETLELYQTPLSEIPIKKLDKNQQDPFVDLVNQILDAKIYDPKANTLELEKEVDQLVYQLYGLTPDEIKVVEDLYPE